MTILNLCCGPARVVVATDTNVARDGHNVIVGEAAKVRVFPDRNLAIASRGAIRALDTLESYVRVSASRDVDHLVSQSHRFYPDLLCRAMSIGTDAANKWQVAIAGWSARKQEMTAAVYEVSRTQCFEKRWQVGADGAFVIALPPIETAELLAQPFSRDAMLSTMRRQLQAAIDDNLEGGYGGRMVNVTMTEDGVVSDDQSTLKS